jgi:hypothetical protein
MISRSRLAYESERFTELQLRVQMIGEYEFNSSQELMCLLAHVHPSRTVWRMHTLYCRIIPGEAICDLIMSGRLVVDDQGYVLLVCSPD